MKRLAVGVLLSLSLLVGCSTVASMLPSAIIGAVTDDKPLLDAQVGGRREGIKFQDNTLLDGDLESLNTEAMTVNVDNGTSSWLIALMIVLLALPDAGTMTDRAWGGVKNRLLGRKNEKENTSS